MKNIIDLLKGKCKENREIILKLEKVYKHDIYTLTEEGFLNGDLWYTYKENIYYDSIEDIINLYDNVLKDNKILTTAKEKHLSKDTFFKKSLSNL